jgi:acyl transferase domain-containing protein
MTHPPEDVISAARLALRVKRLREQTPEADLTGSEPLAIVGIGCRFPGEVHSPADFWRLLLNGVDAITTVPAGRWDAEAYYDPDPQTAGKTNGKWGGFVSDPDAFDPLVFGIAPREAASIDPQQRLLLEAAWEAIWDSGRSPESMAGSRAGVFAGISLSDYERLQFSDAAGLTANSCTGTYHSVASGRISYLLDLRGPSVSIETACSSSLVAVHLACHSLRARECDFALAGGVSLHLLPEHYVGLARLGMLSPDGRCKAFDSLANGFVPSEGCGLVALKRLSGALADGDRIYAVVRGSAVNQDGRTNGLTAPSGLAQQDVVRRALENGRVPPSAIAYVETHGTGTALGDPIEVEALAAALGGAGEPCALGAVKTNIGHLEAAAGVAGLIKAALALYHEQVPANLHFRSLNPHIALDGTRFFVPAAAAPWPRGGKGRFAGVSSFGFSGTNAHVVLEEAPGLPERRAADSGGAVLLPISARTREALAEYARRYRSFLNEEGSAAPLEAICANAALRRGHYEERLAAAASTREEMAALLEDFAEGRTRRGIAAGRAARDPGGIAFLFSGQGSQWAGMGMALFGAEPVFRAAVEECEDRIRRWAGWSLIEKLSAAETGSQLAETEYAQPALFAVEIALARLWESWGIRPAAVIGHSAGEVAAANIAGVLSLDEAVRVVTNRGRLMQAATGQGRMAAVRLPAGAVARELAARQAEVSIAAINGPQSTVISGAAAAVEALVADWLALGVACRFMPVNYAFHSAQMQPYSEELVRLLGRVETRSGAIPILSTVLGRMVSGEELTAEYWGRNIRRAVQFAAAVEAAAAMGLRTFVEVGPHPVLLAPAEESLEGRGALFISSLRRGEGERTAMLTSLASLHAAGHRVAWETVYPEPARPLSLPAYPYQRQRFWLERRRPAAKNRAYPLLGDRVLSPSIRGAAYETELSAAALPYLADHVIAGKTLVPMTAFLEMARAAAREAQSADAALEDVTVLEPLILGDPDNPVKVQTVIEGGRFEIHSLHGDRWTMHASGRIASAAAPPGETGVEMPEAGEPVSAERHYERLRERGATFGAAFQTVETLSTGQERATASVRLAEAERRDAARYGIHPALLDGALQTAVAAAGERAGLFLPFAVERIDCFGPAGASARVLARLRPAENPDVLSADIDVYAESGALAAGIRGLRMKRRAASDDARDAARRVYRTEWRRIERGPAVPARSGSWLVIAEDPTEAGALAGALRKAGLAAKTAATADGLDPIARYAGVVRLIAFPHRADPIGAQEDVCGRTLELAQRMLRLYSPEPPQLRVVTHGAVKAASGDGCDGLAQAPAWGLIRAIGLEYPELRCALTDLDPQAPDWAALAQEIARWDGEPDAALRGGERRAPRLAPVPASSSAPRQWTIPARGSIDNLALQPSGRRAPGPGEVEVEVEASALNFRDVLNVLGMYPGDPGAPGLEFCGRVARTGEGVAGFEPGARVMGLAFGAFQSFITTPAELAVPVPPGLGPIEAATLPNAFLTAYHCLVHLGRLQRGARVLIHAATGGVGLAAVQVAQRIGAEIVATAGSEAKREYLRSLGIRRVFSSRATDFAEDPEGGVDVVLNSLAGEFIGASFSALRPGGRFIEIDKNRIWSDAQAQALGKNVEYFVVDLAGQIEREPGLIQSHLSRIGEMIRSGELRPLPWRVFAFEDAPAAFRLMAQAKHIGKIVLRHHCGLRISPGGSYLVTGGLGAIGLRLSEWLAENGARRLVLAGRSAPGEDAARRIGALRREGVDVMVRSADVACRDQAQELLSEIAAGPAPLAGIVHAAGVIDDGMSADQSWPRLERVLAAKAAGAWNLHELTAAAPLDFFLMCSSVASLTGSPGQSGYAAANAFLDALAEYREARGLPALTVNWGAWAGTGMAARVASGGRGLGLAAVRALPAGAYLDSLRRAAAAGAAQVAIVDADWRNWSNAPRILSEVVERPAMAAAKRQDSIAARLESAPAGNRRKILVDFLHEQARSVLGLNGGGPFLDERQPLLKMGMDSLMAVEFRNYVAAALGRPLSATLLFDHPSIGDLADFLCGGPAASPAPARDAFLDELEKLSDADAERLLNEELEKR